MIHLDDVKPQEEAIPQAESETAEQPSQPAEQTTDTPVVSPDVETQSQERTVPLNVLREERKKRQELQRQLAQRESESRLKQYDGEDINDILQHPMVQELILKDAKRELTDFARDTLDQYPNINPQLKKAILKNARGFVNENTSDLELAKVDLTEYIEEIAQEIEEQEQTETPSKGFKVASTNVPSSQNTDVKPEQIQKILDKPVDTWSEDETSAVEAYSKRSSK